MNEEHWLDVFLPTELNDTLKMFTNQLKSCAKTIKSETKSQKRVKLDKLGLIKSINENELLYKMINQSPTSENGRIFNKY